MYVWVSSSPPIFVDIPTPCFLQATVLRHQRDRVLQLEHLRHRRVQPDRSTSRVVRLRRGQLRLRCAGRLDDRHVREEEPVVGFFPAHGRDAAPYGFFFVRYIPIHVSYIDHRLCAFTAGYRSQTLRI